MRVPGRGGTSSESTVALPGKSQPPDLFGQGQGQHQLFLGGFTVAGSQPCQAAQAMGLSGQLTHVTMRRQCQQLIRVGEACLRVALGQR